MENITPPLPPSASGESVVAGNPFQHAALLLDWSRSDFERRLGFSGGRFTTPNKVLAFIAALLLTAAFYALIVLSLRLWPQTHRYAAMFLERGPCPYPTVLLFFWALSLLGIKWRKLRLQLRAMDLPIMPQQPEFELTPDTARSVRDRMRMMVDNPHHFILLNRIDLALANLHNIGHTADVAAILKIQAENDEAQIASSYGLVNGFMWAIPVLGFIGTVLGLGQAIGAFGGTLDSGGDMAALRGSLQMITSGLATAFDTTLIALVAALILQILVSFLQSRESEFLDTCNDICHKHVAGKLRLSSN
ncbi:MAG TPA: MotA/TolQ/ExbB proton channel family protein [Prosthecobacter sp.]|nr:MotA/TolQ/ExbB proton channel family protein [Prosthecobacter sp.]